MFTFDSIRNWLSGESPVPPTGIHEDDDGGVTIDFLIPLETEKMSEAVNLDAMTPEQLKHFINNQEQAHKDKQKALRSLLRAKIALAPKVVQEEAPAVG